MDPTASDAQAADAATARRVSDAMQPAEIVRAALAAAASRDIDALLRACSLDCELRTPNGVMRGHDGVRRLVAAWPETPPWIRAGEPEHVGDGFVLVPLMLAIEIGERSVDVAATAIWRVADGLVTALHGVAGGREAALNELGLGKTERVRAQSRPPETAAPGSVRTLQRGGVWINETDADGVISRHLVKLAATQAGRDLAVERRTEHLVFTIDGRVSSWKSYVDGPARARRRTAGPRAGEP